MRQENRMEEAIECGNQRKTEQVWIKSIEDFMWNKNIHSDKNVLDKLPVPGFSLSS